jgi:hypothetical protein
MANPNLAGISGIFGKSVANTSILTSPTVVLTASSNRIYRINTLLISNVDSANTVRIGADIDTGTLQVKIIDNVDIPIGSAFTVIDKSVPIYLEEGNSLRVSSNLSNHVNVIVSYEDIG